MFSSNTSQVSDEKLYSEDVFSTYLYTGNGSTQTITNGIDLAGKGGMVWIKSRSAATNNFLFDTTRGVNVELNSNTTDANATLANSVTAFNSNGFAISSATGIGVNAATYASWTFREAPKFFDVVTYTGNGANRNIAHNLGIAPGCIIVKRTDTAADWQVYHRSNANTQYMVLNSTSTAATGSTRWNSTTPTATEFTVGTDATVNASGGTYVAYLFAHDATSDGVIQCGSYTGNGSATGPVVTLGWEPQWLLIRNVTGAGSWLLIDNMRGMPVGSVDATLFAQSAAVENSGSDYVSPTATGFQIVSDSNQVNTSSQTYIYIAIRRGPMKTPTLGTSVFAPIASSGIEGTALTTNFPVDMQILGKRAGYQYNQVVVDRLRGVSTNSSTFNVALSTSLTSAESDFVNVGSSIGWGNTGFLVPANFGGDPSIYWSFRRAPGFFDEVCYTGTGAVLTQSHNLGVVPELMIVKRRTGGTGVWPVYYGDATRALFLEDTVARGLSGAWNDTAPTATQFTVNGASTAVGAAGSTYVAYLFASVPGVSKVGSYTGNGSSQTINCGFAAGARFVMIKRTDSTGDWYVWDTARGIVSGNDPHLSLNTVAAEVTTDDTIDADSSGFVVNQVAATNVNVSSATYIYLAIA